MPPLSSNDYPAQPNQPTYNTQEPQHIDVAQTVKPNPTSLGKRLSLLWSTSKLSLLLIFIILIIIVIGLVLNFTNNGKQSSSLNTNLGMNSSSNSNESDTNNGIKRYTLPEINKSLVSRDFKLYDGETPSDSQSSSLELNMKFPIPDDSAKIDYTGKHSRSGIYPYDSVDLGVNKTDGQFAFEYLGTDHKNFSFGFWRDDSLGMNGGPAQNESIENNLTKYNAGLSSNAGIRGIDISTATLEKVSAGVFIYSANTKDSLGHVGMVKDIIIECSRDVYGDGQLDYNRLPIHTSTTLYDGKLDDYVGDYTKLISTITKSINIKKCGIY